MDQEKIMRMEITSADCIHKRTIILVLLFSLVYFMYTKLLHNKKEETLKAAEMKKQEELKRKKKKKQEAQNKKSRKNK